MVIGVLVAAVLGLGIALAVVASDSGEEDVTTSSVATTPTVTPTTTVTTTTATPATTTTTAEPTTTAETVTEPGDSGGTPSP
jgi:hypothetical protein